MSTAADLRTAARLLLAAADALDADAPNAARAALVALDADGAALDLLEAAFFALTEAAGRATPAPAPAEAGKGPPPLLLAAPSKKRKPGGEYRKLQARCRELGLPARGSAAVLAARLAAAEEAQPADRGHEGRGKAAADRGTKQPSRGRAKAKARGGTDLPAGVVTLYAPGPDGTMRPATVAEARAFLAALEQGLRPAA